MTREGLKKALRQRIVSLTAEAKAYKEMGRETYRREIEKLQARSLECERTLDLFDKSDPK